jgi:hypothetical protein
MRVTPCIICRGSGRRHKICSGGYTLERCSRCLGTGVDPDSDWRAPGRLARLIYRIKNFIWNITDDSLNEGR